MSSPKYSTLACAVVLTFLVAVSCGGEGQPVRTVSPQAFATQLPFYSTPMPISQSGALWDWITANSPEVEPVLRPAYLPSDLTKVTVGILGQERGCILFRMEYSDGAGAAKLVVGGGPWYNLPLPQSDTVGEEVEVRGNVAGYELYHAAEPLGLAFLTWHEPGRWGRPGDDWHRYYVEYLISAEGFPKEELLKVANGLQPAAQ